VLTKLLTKKSNFLHLFILVSILLLAAYLRFSHLNWDQGLNLHPDERNIVAAVLRLNWPKQINPEFYAYNGFPLFLIDISSQVISLLTRNINWSNDAQKITLIARFYSASFSLLSVYFFYLISKLLFQKKTALITAFLAATTVGFIQHAHYGVTESLLVFELLIITYLSIKFKKKQNQKLFLLMAVVLGISIGTKTSALAFALIPLITIFMIYKFNTQTLIKLFFFLSITGFTFYIASPNTIKYFDQFLASMKYEGAVVSGKQAVFYTMQFIDTSPYLFQINSLFWQSSFAIVFLSVWAFYLFLKDKNKYKTLWPFLIYSFIYFAYIGSWYAKFNRYLIPFIPTLILLASLVIDQFNKHKFYKLLLILLLLINSIWAIAFLQVFKKEHTRITASHWIEKNIEAQSTILVEEWDERLPSITNSNITYQYQTLKLYQNDNEQKIKTLTKQLTEGDYLIIASRRLFKSIPRSPKHLYTKKYYQLLFAQKLGYQQIALFNSYPSFFGIEIIDEKVEETFRVFDHPSIMIFKNIDRLSNEELFDKIFEK
jgi:hypothetical protein